MHLFDRETRKWQTHHIKSKCNSIDFCGNDRWLAIAQGLGNPGVALFDMEDFVFAEPLPVEDCSSVKASTDGNTLYVNDVVSLSAWNVSGWNLINRFESVSSLPMATHPDGRSLAMAVDMAKRRSGGVSMIDVQNGGTTGETDFPIFEDVRALDFSADGSRLAAGSGNGLYLWDTSTWERVIQRESGAPAASENLTVRSDSGILAVSDAAHRIQQWDLSNGELLSTAELAASNGRSPDIVDLEFSPDGRHLAVAGAERAIRFIQPISGAPFRSIPILDQVMSLTFNADGTRLYTTHWDGTCVERDGNSTEVVRTFQISDGVLRQLTVDVSRDGQWLLAAWEIVGAIGVHIIDLNSGELTELNRVGMPSAIFTPDQHSILMSADQKFLLAPRNNLNASVRISSELQGGRGAFRSAEQRVVANPLTGEMVGASKTGILHFWTSAGDQLRTVFIGPPGGRIPDLEFTPDGRYLITANGNGTIFVIRAQARN